MIVRPLTAALLYAACLSTGLAQEASPPAPRSEQDSKPGQSEAQPAAPRPIRNAPQPRALELAAYIFSASNVCGYPIGTSAFEALLARMNVKPEDVALRGPFGNRIVTIFSLMSNDMAKHREQSCLAVAGEYGPEGNIAKGVLLPPGSEEGSVAPAPPAAQ